MSFHFSPQTLLISLSLDFPTNDSTVTLFHSIWPSSTTKSNFGNFTLPTFYSLSVVVCHLFQA